MPNSFKARLRGLQRILPYLAVFPASLVYLLGPLLSTSHSPSCISRLNTNVRYG